MSAQVSNEGSSRRASAKDRGRARESAAADPPETIRAQLDEQVADRGSAQTRGETPTRKAIGEIRS